MAVVFISYKREDMEFAKEVMDVLASRGFSPWYDQDIRGGEEWKQVIDNFLNDCFAVIVIVTPAALSSQYITYEWSYALGLKKTVIPIILKKPTKKAPMHPRLDDHNYRDFTNPDKRPQEWEKLTRDLELLVTETVIPEELVFAKRKIDNASTKDERREAIQNLGQLELSQVVTILEELLGRSHPEVRYFAAIELAKRPNAEKSKAVEILTEKAEQGDADAVYYLGIAATLESIDKLHTFFRLRSDMHYVMAIINAYQNNNRNWAILAPLIDYILDLDPGIGTPLAKQLYNLKEPQALPMLHLLLERHPELNARVWAVKAISEIKETQEILYLVDLLRSYPFDLELEVARYLAKNILNALLDINVDLTRASLSKLRTDQSLHDDLLDITDQTMRGVRWTF